MQPYSHEKDGNFTLWDAPKMTPEVTVSISVHVHLTRASNVDRETLKTVEDREGEGCAAAPPP